MRQSQAAFARSQIVTPSQKPQPFLASHGARPLSQQPEPAAEFRHSFPRFTHQV